MKFGVLDRRLVVVVGGGGVGKTTLAAALGVESARQGRDTLVMTFDPSLRLKDALGVGESAREAETRVPLDTRSRLSVSLLDARITFDRLIERYAPDEDSARRIRENPFYQHLAGTFAGILEYMAVERLYEAASDSSHGRIILDTPPTSQALDFLEAPERMVRFLDSSALRMALRPWFDERGRFRVRGIRPIAKGIEALLDRVIGLDLLREMAEFFRAFTPLYAGFRERAKDVERLLRARETVFVLVTGPGGDRIPETTYFARRLDEAGYHLGTVVVNQVHPPLPRGNGERCPASLRPGLELFAWLARRDADGLEMLHSLLGVRVPVVSLPLLPESPTGVASLDQLGSMFLERLARPAALHGAFTGPSAPLR